MADLAKSHWKKFRQAVIIFSLSQWTKLSSRQLEFNRRKSRNNWLLKQVQLDKRETFTFREIIAKFSCSKSSMRICRRLPGPHNVKETRFDRAKMNMVSTTIVADAATASQGRISGPFMFAVCETAPTGYWLGQSSVRAWLALSRIQLWLQGPS